MKDNKLNRVSAILGEDAVSRLVALSIATEREQALETMLNSSLQAYLSSRANGEERYGKDARVGKVFVSKFNNRNPYQADITFAPKGAILRQLRYSQSVIGVLDYSDKTYSFSHSAGELPEQLVEDVEGAMQMFGLHESIKPYSREEDY